MAAYNDVDGVPCHINGELFQTILRQEMGHRAIGNGRWCALIAYLMFCWLKLKALLVH